MEKYSVLAFVPKVERGDIGMLGWGENRKCGMFSQCPLSKQEPLSIKNPANYYLLGNMVLVGKTAGTEVRNVLIMKSSGTDLIVDRAWFGLQPAE